MKKRLAFVVLAKRSAGKSTTWYTLFGRKVRTGKHRLQLDNSDWVQVLLINGSPEEREEDIGELIERHFHETKPDIILCSVQYTSHGRDSIEFLQTHGYDLHVQWLNPGFRDGKPYHDSLEFVPLVEDGRGVIEIHDGKLSPEARVADVRETINSWTSASIESLTP